MTQLTGALVLLLLGAACSTGPSGQPVAIDGLANTGANLRGSADMVWEVECTPILPGAAPCPGAGVQSAQRVSSPDDSWVIPTAGSSWIGVNDLATLPGGIGDDLPRYQYIYRMSFDLSNYDPATALIALEWAADNFYGGYRLNSSSFTGALPDDGQWTTYKTLTLAGPAATFVSGRNLLEFRVLGDGETDGFIVRSMQGTAARR